MIKKKQVTGFVEQQQDLEEYVDEVVAEGLADAANGLSLGSYNAATNTPALTATPPSSEKEGAFYYVTTAGNLTFAGQNFASGQLVSEGDVIFKQGTKWAWIKSTINASELLNAKGIVSYNTAIATEKTIANAIKDFYCEIRTGNYNDVIAVRTIGYIAGIGLTLQLYNVTTSAVLYTIALDADATSKPSGIKEHWVHIPNDYYVFIRIDYSAFTGNTVTSNLYSIILSKGKYNQNRLSFQQFSNGLKSFSMNNSDERIALAIRKIYFEFTDDTIEFAITQIGYTGGKLQILIKNLTTLSTIIFELPNLLTAKPTGIIPYEVHNVGESYLNVEINWDAFLAQAISSSTNALKVLVNKYSSVRQNQLNLVDENEERYRQVAPKKFVNGLIDWSKYPTTRGFLSSNAGTSSSIDDDSNTNRIRTTYSIPVKNGATINYSIATGYTLIIQQVQTIGFKSYVWISDSSYLSGTGSFVLNNKTDSIRVFFRKVSGTEVKVQTTEVNTTNFAVTTDVGQIDLINNATLFTDNALFNRFVKELFIEGLDSSIPYIFWFIKRATGNNYKIYIRNKNTNTTVFQFEPPATDGLNEKSIFDRTLSGVRVRAILDWSALPLGYDFSGLSINITDKAFSLNNSPRLAAFYADKEVRGNKLFNTRTASAVDNNHIAHSKIPHKRDFVAWANSINAEIVKADSIYSYDTIGYDKNGSVGVKIGNYFYEFCNERDVAGYDSTSNIFVRKIDLAKLEVAKTAFAGAPLISKVKILGYGDTIGGEAMTRIPYVFSGYVNGTTIRIFIRVLLATSGAKFGYIDYNTTNDTFTAFAEITLNGLAFSYLNYYAYIRDNVGSTLVTGQNSISKDLTLGRHIVSYSGYYYMLIGCSVGMNPYDGSYHAIARSTDGVSWTIVYVFSDRSGQDDGDMYVKNGVLYAQLRQCWGSGYSTIVAYDLTTQKEVTSQNLVAGTSRGEFFEYAGNLYLLLNTDDTRQFASLWRIDYNSTYGSMLIYSILSMENGALQNSNWSICEYNSKLFVFWGVQAYQLKIDQYNNSINTRLFNLIKD